MPKLTYFGHSCFALTINGTKILFDPFITGNELASDIDITDIQPNIILITHGHQDHVLDVHEIADQSGANVYANFEVANWLTGQGVEKVTGMNHGGTLDLGHGITAKYVNAVHTSSLPDGSYGGQPGGFVINWEMEDEFGSLYHSGDTALHQDMIQIAEDGGPHGIDVALLCLGDHFTMGYTDAIKAADMVQANQVFGHHFDTFEPIEINHAEVKQAFDQSGIDLTLPKIGEIYTI
jgi:L-ascorbate metabolism protein UlaG (beta-lactamase superfamily)